MHRFTDATGRAWPVTIHRGAVRKLWDLLRLNLHDPADVARLCNAERYLLIPQALEVLLHDEAGRVWPEAAGQPAELLDRFEALLDQDEIFDRAHAALCEELADFTRSRGRVAVAKYLDAAPRLIAKEARASLAQLPNPDTLEAQLDKRLERMESAPAPIILGEDGKTDATPGVSSTASAENSEPPTPTTSPGDS